MRWKLGNYTVKINPKSNSKTWDAQQNETINMNGEVSNPNLVWNGSQDFTIDVYEKPTYSQTTTLTGSYIGATEKRLDEKLYLLTSGGTFDVKGKTNTSFGSHTIVTGNGVTLPPVKPSSINHWDSGLAFIYHEATQATLLVTDENGVANRKYIYSTDDSKYVEDVCWDYSSYWLTLNPYGQIYKVDTTTGVSSFLFQFDDYDANKSASKKRYTSIFAIEKNAKICIGILQDGRDLVFIDYLALEIICKSELKLGNVLAVSYSNYSEDYFAVFSSKILQVFPNTARIDIEYLKFIIANGQVTIYDENNMPSILVIKNMSIDRDSNTNEARYEVQFSATIAYSNIGFNNTWITNHRSN
jgi:hypothetical protein